MKIQLILCTHGRFGEELLRSAEMIAGPMNDIKVFSLLPGMDPFDLRSEVESYLTSQEDVCYLAMTDLYGGSPSNMLAALIPSGHIEVVTGLNLAMLIEVYSKKDFLDSKALKTCALETLRKSGFDVNEELKKILKKKEVE